MKKIVLFLVVSFIVSCSDDDSGTPTAKQDIFITTSEELAAFAAKNITHVEGSLTITGDVDSDDLSELEFLQKVDGNLTIHYCNKLVKLSGLKNLVAVGGNFAITDNQRLISLDRLTELQTVTGELRVKGNNLSNLDGLDNLFSVGDLYISDAFTNINALHNLKTAGRVTIPYSNLVNLEGLNNITSLKTLSVGLGIKSLEGLDNLASVEIIDIKTSSLENLRGLEGLTALKRLSIVSNSYLISLDGLQNLKRVNLLLLNNNSRLTSLENLENLTTVGDNVETDGIYIWGNNLDSLDGLEHITAFNGSVVLEEDITSFCPLQNILSTGQLGSVILNRYGKPVPTMQDIIAGDCTVD